MRARIAAPFADSRAADLSLAHGLNRLPALGTLVVEPGVELRVLGASHQVVLDVGGRSWSETVACLPGRGGELPARTETLAHDLVARFEARCTRLTDAELAGRVAALRHRCEEHTRALLGVFPGSPLAVTALLVGDRGLWWRTWHAYPQTGELVETRTVVAVR